MQNPLKETGEYGAHEVLKHGHVNVKESLEMGHPLELSERNYAQNEFQRSLRTMRTLQGLHAPLKIVAELRACKTVGRLPCLPSSNLMRDTLLGNDDVLTFDDVYNDPERSEEIRPAFAVMAKANWTGF
ncbi:proteasome maturation protein [Galendromus occidentalis]|uniref:Proteasome maturation protein n=1 Tax=Galendromus occidentalis TaxID=34638 RepID=A0AAJ6VXW6_9ACAR|nr:proteasome maturation protein [Galendromus occidentalis]